LHRDCVRRAPLTLHFSPGILRPLSPSISRTQEITTRTAEPCPPTALHPHSALPTPSNPPSGERRAFAPPSRARCRALLQQLTGAAKNGDSSRMSLILNEIERTFPSREFADSSRQPLSLSRPHHPHPAALISSRELDTTVAAIVARSHADATAFTANAVQRLVLLASDRWGTKLTARAWNCVLACISNQRLALPPQCPPPTSRVDASADDDRWSRAVAIFQRMHAHRATAPTHVSLELLLKLASSLSARHTALAASTNSRDDMNSTIDLDHDSPSVWDENGSNVLAALGLMEAALPASATQLRMRVATAFVAAHTRSMHPISSGALSPSALLAPSMASRHLGMAELIFDFMERPPIAAAESPPFGATLPRPPKSAAAMAFIRSFTQNEQHSDIASSALPFLDSRAEASLTLSRSPEPPPRTAPDMYAWQALTIGYIRAGDAAATRAALEHMLLAEQEDDDEEAHHSSGNSHRADAMQDEQRVRGISKYLFVSLVHAMWFPSKNVKICPFPTLIVSGRQKHSAATRAALVDFHDSSTVPYSRARARACTPLASRAQPLGLAAGLAAFAAVIGARGRSAARSRAAFASGAVFAASAAAAFVARRSAAACVADNATRALCAAAAIAAFLDSARGQSRPGAWLCSSTTRVVATTILASSTIIASSISTSTTIDARRPLCARMESKRACRVRDRNARSNGRCGFARIDRTRFDRPRSPTPDGWLSAAQCAG
jgi:hypothetical protein